MGGWVDDDDDDFIEGRGMVVYALPRLLVYPFDIKKKIKKNKKNKKESKV